MWLEGTDGGALRRQSQRGRQRPDPGDWVVLILGLFALRSHSHLSCSALGYGAGPEGWVSTGFSRSTAQRLEGICARGKPRFSLPLLSAPGGFPSIALAPDAKVFWWL